MIESGQQHLPKFHAKRFGIPYHPQNKQFTTTYFISAKMKVRILFRDLLAVVLSVHLIEIPSPSNIYGCNINELFLS
ncbi:MAG: hypothetical protein KJ941_08445, partial [Bacteroidetes bacterium]|nr:hypothetical protein [Bacteroidota bacterium]